MRPESPGVIVAAHVILLLSASAAVILRLLSRKTKNTLLQADDYTIIFTLILDVGICTIGIFAGASKLFSVSLAELSLAQLKQHQKLIWSSVLLTHLAFGMTKISVILLYKRIFSIPKIKIICNLLLGVVSAWTLTSVLVHVFSARPLDGWWTFGGDSNPLLWQPTIRFPVFLFTMAVMDLVLDIVTLVIPLPVIRTLHISKKKKATLSAVFALGFFCIIAEVVRIYYMVQLYFTFDQEHTPPTKFAAVATEAFLWANTECCISTLTACLPTLAPLATRIGQSDLFGRSIASLLGSRGQDSTDRAPLKRLRILPSTKSFNPNRDWNKLDHRIQVTDEIHVGNSRDEESLELSPVAIARDVCGIGNR